MTPHFSSDGYGFPLNLVWYSESKFEISTDHPTKTTKNRMYKLLSMFSFRYFLTVLQISERFINGVLSLLHFEVSKQIPLLLKVCLHFKSRFSV